MVSAIFHAPPDPATAGGRYAIKTETSNPHPITDKGRGSHPPPYQR